jgi:hypothetical protein
MKTTRRALSHCLETWIVCGELILLKPQRGFDALPTPKALTWTDEKNIQWDNPNVKALLPGTIPKPPRQLGYPTLTRKLLPHLEYVSLENSDQLQRSSEHDIRNRKVSRR